MEHQAVLVRRRDISVMEALALYGDTSAYEVYNLLFTSLGINEVKQIIHEANLRPQFGETRLLVVSLSSITPVAEQALLKILEEPPNSTRFLFVVNNNISFIPTLQSRFLELFADKEIISDQSDFLKFEKLSLAERLIEVSERISKKDFVWVDNVRAGLKQYLTNTNVAKLETLKSLAFILSRLNVTGSANKILLEYLALILPLRT